MALKFFFVLLGIFACQYTSINCDETRQRQLNMDLHRVVLADNLLNNVIEDEDDVMEFSSPRSIYAKENREHHNKNIVRDNDNNNSFNKNKYTNWNGGMYQTYQKGSVRISEKGEHARVFPSRNHGTKKAYRGKVVATIYPPNTQTQQFKSPIYEPISDEPYDNTCVLCPEERVLIANKRHEKVLMLEPKLKFCNGNFVNKNYRFKATLGARPGSLLTEGTHLTIGEIYNRNKPVKGCHLKTSVIVQQCDDLSLRLPAYLNYNCDHGNLWGSQCSFSCENNNLRIRGVNRMVCNDNLKWEGAFPSCEKTSTSCEMPSTPENGKVLCNTPHHYERNKHNNTGTSLPERTRCHIKCHRGYKIVPKKSIVSCRNGEWVGYFNSTCEVQRRSGRRSIQKLFQ